MSLIYETYASVLNKNPGNKRGQPGYDDKTSVDKFHK